VDEGASVALEEPAPVEEAAITTTPEDEAATGVAADAAVEGSEIEVFYTFTWGGNRSQGGKPRGKGRPQGGDRPRGKGKPKGGRPDRGGPKAKNFEARPPKKDKIDPDNPFAAALMGLKDKS
jgi:ATP-dependent RNA helicase SUPV3L1/SUV3